MWEKREALRNEIGDFVNSVEKDRDPLATVEDEVMFLKAAFAWVQ